MRILACITFFIFSLHSIASAQDFDPDTLDQILRNVCVNSEGEYSSIEVEGDGKGGITFSGIKPGAEGEFSYTKEEIKGSVNVERFKKLDGEQILIENEKIRECMQNMYPKVVESLKETKASCSVILEADKFSCYGTKLAETNNLDRTGCEDFVAKNATAKCGLWQDGTIPGANACAAYDAGLKSGCEGCNAGVTFAMTCSNS